MKCVCVPYTHTLQTLPFLSLLSPKYYQTFCPNLNSLDLKPVSTQILPKMLLGFFGGVWLGFWEGFFVFFLHGCVILLSVGTVFSLGALKPFVTYLMLKQVKNQHAAGNGCFAAVRTIAG